MFSVPNGYIAGGTPDTIKQGTVLTFNCDPGSFIKHSSYSSKKQEEGTESVISSNPPAMQRWQCRIYNGTLDSNLRISCF